MIIIKSSVFLLIFWTESSFKIKWHSCRLLRLWWRKAQANVFFFFSGALFQVGVRTGVKPIPLGSLNSLRLLKRRRRLALIYRLTSILPSIRMFADASFMIRRRWHKRAPVTFFVFVRRRTSAADRPRVDVVGAKIGLRLDTRRCASLRRSIDKFLHRSMVVASTGQSRRQFGRGDRLAARWMLWFLTPDPHGDRACLEPQQLPASRLYA